MIAFAFALVLAAPTAKEVVQKIIDADPWGFDQGEVVTHAVMKDKRGETSDLRFSAISRRYEAQLSRTLVRVSVPPDLSGAGFLQTQKRDGDDERFLFLPELKRSRRISGALRSNSFMGTDFSFADIDKKDLREGELTLNGEETLGKYPCWKVTVKPTRSDSEYSRIEIWSREDNGLPVVWRMYDKANQPLKVLTAEEVRRVGTRWFITRSRMQNVRDQHETEWVLEQVNPRTDIGDDQFSVRNLEKM